MGQRELTYNQMVVDSLEGDATDRVFRALAAATRRDIVARAIRQEQSVSALARKYKMSIQAVQKHVAVLERAHLVTKERRGREQIVSAQLQTLRSVTELLDAYEQLWIERTERIADVLAGGDGSTT
jgi:DNA-binding transcriptional ArsR family regulator